MSWRKSQPADHHDLNGAGHAAEGAPAVAGDAGDARRAQHQLHSAGGGFTDCFRRPFDDRAIGKTEQFCPNAKIIHVDIDRAELGKIKQPHVAIQGDVAEVLAQLNPQIEAQPREEWRQLVADLQREFPCAIPQESDPLSHYGLINAVAACVDDEAIITTDVGQHQMWTAQAYPLNRPRQWLTSGGLGTMGFGLPAAIGAALANPQRKVICFSGDGSLMMNIQEMATAAENQLDVKLFC